MGGGLNFARLTTITNSTLSGNSATNDGGAMFVFETTVGINNSTLTMNSAGKRGGGMFLQDGVNLTLFNTIVAGNTATTSGPDIRGAVSSNGVNLR